MTDTPTPERGDGTTERDEMLADGLRLAAKLPGSIMSVMADEIMRLRAECARLREQLREDRRDYAADSRMASAVIDVLRELMPNWESRFYDVPESTMAECAVYAIRQLATPHPGAPRDGE